MEVNELLALKNHIKEFINKYDVKSLYIDITEDDNKNSKYKKSISLNIEI